MMSMHTYIGNCYCNVLYILQEGFSAIFYAMTVGPAMVKVMLTEFQCNPNLLPLVSH